MRALLTMNLNCSVNSVIPHLPKDSLKEEPKPSECNVSGEPKLTEPKHIVRFLPFLFPSGSSGSLGYKVNGLIAAERFHSIRV